MLSPLLPESTQPVDLTESLVRFWPPFPTGTVPDVVVAERSRPTGACARLRGVVEDR